MASWMNEIGTDLTIGYAGQWAEAHAPKHFRSAAAEGSGIVAGAPLMRGTDPQKQVKAFAASSPVNGETFAGFALLETTRSPGGIADEDPVSCVVLGSIYLLASEAVSAGEDVAFNPSTGALTGLGADEIPAAGVVRLPGCKWVDSASVAGVCIAFVDILGASSLGGDMIVLQAVTAASGGAGTDLTEQVIGSVPVDGRVVLARYTPTSGAVAAGTGATANNLQINKHEASDPATQVVVADGSNVDAEAQAWFGDGVVAQWEAAAFTLDSDGADVTAGDVLTYEQIAGASYTYPACIVEVFIRIG